MVILLAVSLGLVLCGAMAVLAFQAPVRAAGGLMTVAVGAVATLACLAIPLLPGVVLWCFVGGVGLLLLSVSLLLNLGVDERGKRGMRFLKGLVVAPVCVLFAAIAGIQLPTLQATTMSASAPPPLTAAAISGVVSGEMAVATATALLALAATVLGARVIARRRV